MCGVNEECLICEYNARTSIEQVKMDVKMIVKKRRFWSDLLNNLVGIVCSV